MRYSNDSLKILHLLGFHLWSGPAEPTANLLLEQRKAGLISELCYDTVHPPTPCEEPIEPRLIELGIVPPFKMALSPKANPLKQLGDYCQLSRHFSDYDVVHTHMSHDHSLALASHKSSKLIIVRTIHAARSFSTSWGRAHSLRKADGLIVCTETHRNWLVNNLSIAPQKIAVIQPGLDVAFWQHPASFDSVTTLTLPPGPRVAMVAMMQQDRGHREVLRAWAKVVAEIPEAKLIMAGEGEGLAAFRQLTAELGLNNNVYYTGYLKTDNLRALYQNVDFTILVSTGNDLAARAMGESWANGRPTVVVDSPNEYEKLRRAALLDGAASLSPALIAAADTALAETIIRLLKNPQLVQELGSKAKSQVLKQRSLAMESQKTMAFYQMILQQKHPDNNNRG